MLPLFSSPSRSPPCSCCLCFQNIIKKVSGQKFVYKFVSQPDPSLPDGGRGDEEALRRDGANPSGQPKGLGVMTPACPSKSLAQVPAPVGGDRIHLL